MSIKVLQFRPLCVFLILLLSTSIARSAGGAFAVDDAAVEAPKRCKAEAWVSGANNSPPDWSTAVAAGCVVPFFTHRLELGAAIQRTSEAGEHANALTVKAKAPVPGLDYSSNDRFGLALVWGGSFDAMTGQSHTMFFSAPATLRLTEALTANVNVGYHEDKPEKHNAVTWGAGFEFNLKSVSLEHVTLIAETFSNHRDHIATQAGIRFALLAHADLDLIYGYNLASEQANWLTVGLNLRF